MRGSRSPAAPGSGRRRVRQLLVATAVVGATVLFRERKLAVNTRRFGLPG